MKYALTNQDYNNIRKSEQPNISQWDKKSKKSKQPKRK